MPSSGLVIGLLFLSGRAVYSRGKDDMKSVIYVQRSSHAISAGLDSLLTNGKYVNTDVLVSLAFAQGPCQDFECSPSVSEEFVCLLC